MKIARIVSSLTLAALLAACASGPGVYPQPYIGKSLPIAASPAQVVAFKTRVLHTPPRSDLQDLAESYISREVQHPSSVVFQNEFESVGKSIAICGLVRYRNKYDQMTDWRPFFVEFTRKASKGTEAPYSYNPEDELAKLCGPTPIPPGA